MKFNIDKERVSLFFKVLFMMKLTVLLLSISFLQVNATVYAQKITLMERNATLENVLKEISKQSSYDLVFNPKMLKESNPVDLDLSNVSLQEALEKCFSNQPLTYSIAKNTIVVKRKLADKRNTFQQEIIGGIVEDSDGRPLPGVSVKIKGTSQGTVTDNEGRYSISVSRSNGVLVFSFVGFASQEITIVNNKVLNVILLEETSSLNEVVVVGYGTVKKSDVTGSISSVTNDEINAYPSANVMQALVGRASGVQVKQNTGAPGGTISIRVRGTNSIVGNNEPLYVVDGFPVSNAEGINNSSIESIEILKDASAVAIYGSRASNGVVLITTKKGKIGESKVSLKSSFGIQQLIKKIEMMNAEEFGSYYNQLYANMGRPPLFTETEMSGFSSMGKGTDWQDIVFRKNAPIQDHSLNISGGNSKTQFSIIGSIFDQDGIIQNSDYKRYALNNNIQHKLSESLSIDINLALSKSKTFQKLSSGGRWGTSLIGSAFAIPPILPVYNDDGSYMEPTEHFSLVSEALYNPLNYINEQSDEDAQSTVLVNGAISYRIIDGLVLRISGGIESKNARSDFYQTKNFVNNTNGIARVVTTEYTSLLNENTLSYTNTFKKHNVSAVLGFTYQDFLTESLNGGGSGFLSDLTETHDLGTAAVPSIPGTGYSQSALLSSLGRINYTYNNRYLFTVSFRADGSSIYTAGNKWGYFPSAAFSWRLSDENFFKNLEFVQDLRLRTSWGRAGSQAISPYSTLNRLSSGSTVFGNSLYTTMAPGTRVAANLKWETTDQINLGLDWSLLNGRLQFTADYYSKKTKDLLNAVQLARSTGYTNSLRNIGSISNKGFEFSISSNIVSSESFKWDLNANISFNRSEVLKLYGGQDILAGELAMIRFTDWGNTYREGEPLGIMYGYKEDGYDDNGYLKFKSHEKVKIGDPNPNFIFGLNSNLSYGDFSLSMFLSGSQGNDIINLSAISYTVDNTFGTNKLKEVFYNSWTPENPKAKYPKPNQEQEYLFSDRYVEDGSYIRLRNIELSYNLPIQHIAGLKNAKIYVSGQNLITLTKYSWTDPDVNSRGGANSLDQGIDYATYPTAKSYTLGVLLNF